MLKQVITIIKLEKNKGCCFDQKIFENLIMLGYLGKCMTLFYRVNQKTMGRSDDLFLTKLVDLSKIAGVNLGSYLANIGG